MKNSRVRKPGVLLVDDDAGALGKLTRGLRHEGFAIWSAPGGRRALVEYQRHRRAIALVLLEVNLPVQDGPATFAALQQINPKVRGCFMGRHTGTYTEEQLLELGATALFNKPFRPREVAAVLRHLLGIASKRPRKDPRCPSVLSWRWWGRTDPTPLTALPKSGPPVRHAGGYHALDWCPNHHDETDHALPDVRPHEWDGPPILASFQVSVRSVRNCSPGGRIGNDTHEGPLQCGAGHVPNAPGRAADRARLMQEWLTIPLHAVLPDPRVGAGFTEAPGEAIPYVACVPHIKHGLPNAGP